jgi:hypothetical protein
MPSSQTWYGLHASSPEAEASTYSTEFDGSQDFSNTLLSDGILPNYGIHDLCMIGDYTVYADSQSAGGERYIVHTPDGPTWKIRVSVLHYSL